MNADARQDFALAFLSILFEGAPFILLGTLISGFIDIYLPAGTMDRFLPKNRNLAVLVSGLLGAVFPVCECAVVPVIRRLVGKGLPLGCALAYMLAAPIVNPITALSTWKAFQGQAPLSMTCGRMLLGYLVAVGVGLIVSRISMRRVLRKAIADKVEGSATAFLGALADEIHHGFHHVGRLEGEPTSAAETLATLTGACRDTAVLYIAACRSQGLAARFVSGYSMHHPPEVSEHELHAWAEVYLPGGGWRGFDPSLGLAVADGHGACRYRCSDSGSRLACEQAAEGLRAHGESDENRSNQSKRTRSNHFADRSLG